MLRKRKTYILFSLILMIFVISLALPLMNNHKSLNSNKTQFTENPLISLSQLAVNMNPNNIPKSSISLEGVDNVKISELIRTMEMKGTGLLSIIDSLTILNQNNFSISSILIGIPANNSDDLIYYKAQSGVIPLTLAKTDFILQEDIQTVVINLIIPLQPNQTTTVSFSQIYKDTIEFEYVGTTTSVDEKLTFEGYVFPLLPYEVEGTIYTKVLLPEGQSEILDKGWGTELTGKNAIKFEWTPDYLEPFLENMGGDEIITVSVKDSSTTKLEISQLVRTITISPWGIMKVKENYFIQNCGTIPVEEFEISIPEVAVNLEIYDFLGEFEIGVLDVDQAEQEIQGIQFIPNLQVPGFQTGTFKLSQYRGDILPNSTFQFSLQYQLNLNEYSSTNWFQQSLQMFIYPSYFEYLGKNQITQITINGASNIESITAIPNGIINSHGEITLTYYEPYLVPMEVPLQYVSFTYSLDIFKLLAWPILYIMIIMGICSVLVILIKRSKEPETISEAKKEELPVSEIKEFCSLYTEKHALLLEIAKAEEELKRKKLPKKKFRTIQKRNEAKIRTIEEELKPFKQILKETNSTFENIIKNIELLEAERQSIQDGMKKLEERKKQGKIASRSVYVSLMNDFIKRLNKVEKSIDKSIQQLRSYII